jgi:hypothetical protein
VEGLEARELMAGNLTATLTGGVLRIEGTDRADYITVRDTGGQTSVDGTMIAVDGTERASAAGVGRIEVSGGTDIDTIWVSDRLPLAAGNVLLDGGAGGAT